MAEVNLKSEEIAILHHLCGSFLVEYSDLEGKTPGLDWMLMKVFKIYGKLEVFNPQLSHGKLLEHARKGFTNSNHKICKKPLATSVRSN